MIGRRRALLWAVVAALIAISVTVGVVTWIYPGPNTAAITNSTSTPRVTATVELRPARQVISLSGTFAASKAVAVGPMAAASDPVSAGDATTATQPSAAASPSTGPSASSAPTASSSPRYVPPTVREVVSRQVLSVGTQVRPGDLLGEVSGRPIIAFPASAPLFRDLVTGCSGSDVSALQQILVSTGDLSVSPTGVYGSQTQRAVNSLFRRFGYDVPLITSGVAGFPLSDVGQLPGDTAVVDSLSKVGAVVDADHPLLKVTSGAPTLTARADELQSMALSVGTAVMVQVGSGTPMPSTVQAIGAFQAGDTSTPAGHTVTIAVPNGMKSTSEPILITEADKIPTAPAVPVNALRQDDAGSSYVMVVDSTGKTQRESVQVARQIDGYAILSKGPSVGTTVIVSGA